MNYVYTLCENIFVWNDKINEQIKPIHGQNTHIHTQYTMHAVHYTLHEFEYRVHYNLKSAAHLLMFGFISATV